MFNLTVSDVIKQLKAAGIIKSARRVQDLCQSGRLVGQKKGISWMINQESVTAFIKNPNPTEARRVIQKPIPAVALKNNTIKNKRFLLTSAQDHTDVHPQWWDNLYAYAEKFDADIFVAPFTYKAKAKDGYGEEMFDERVQKFLVYERMQLGGVQFCANMPLSPTEAKPLNGLRTFTHQDWGIFPHPKVALLSIPTMADTPTKMVMTTGASTVPNYLQRKTGMKAEFHHVIGATLLEFDKEGNHFTRQLNADDDGNFQDLTNVVKNGKVIENQRVEAITWGDIHYAKKHPEVFAEAFYGDNSMLAVLKPKTQFFHDVLDFAARNHHNIIDPHFWTKMREGDKGNVEREITHAAEFIRHTQRKWCQTVVVESNHDHALGRWLKYAEARYDYTNVGFFHRANAVMHDNATNPKFSIFEHCMRTLGELKDDVVFVDQNGGYPIMGIECGLHGHRGSNGTRGGIANFANMAMKMNIGHSHSAAILDGVYQAGVLGLLDMGYNIGPSSWSHTSTIVYPNGKRTLITQSDLTGAWRA